jgi:hypothetical protein
LIRNGWRSRVAFRKEPLGACARRPFRCRRPTQSGRDRFGIWRQSSRGNSAGCGAAYLSAGSCTVFAPDRRASCGRGLGTRRPRDPDRPLVCQDETSKQLLAETRVPIPIKPARPARCDHSWRLTDRPRGGPSGRRLPAHGYRLPRLPSQALELAREQRRVRAQSVNPTQPREAWFELTMGAL